MLARVMIEIKLRQNLALWNKSNFLNWDLAEINVSRY